MKIQSILFVLCLMGSVVFAQEKTVWTIDQGHSNIGFAVSHMTISEVEGEFEEFTARVVSQGEDFDGAVVQFSAAVSSITTDSEKRDAHLQGADFFDAENNPNISFNG